MSVFRWRYDETCEGRYCCGDCDKCDKEDEEVDDLISRQAALDAISLFFDKAYIEDADVHKNDMLYELNLVPSAQPEPIKINIDHELTKDEYEKLRKDLADAPVVLLPSAQPQITYCAECIHWKHSDVRKNYCEVFDWINTAEDFCSFAERRTDG